MTTNGTSFHQLVIKFYAARKNFFSQFSKKKLKILSIRFKILFSFKGNIKINNNTKRKLNLTFLCTLQKPIAKVYSANFTRDG